MNRRSGFTLIELLIVVLVIAILAAIGISKYQSFVTESRQKSCMSNLGALNNAYAVFETRNSSIPIDDACTQVIHPVSGEPMTTHANSQMYWRYQTPNFVAIDGTDGQTMQLLPQGAITQSANPARFSELGKIVQDTKLFCCPELAKRYGGATATFSISSSRRRRRAARPAPTSTSGTRRPTRPTATCASTTMRRWMAVATRTSSSAVASSAVPTAGTTPTHLAPPPTTGQAPASPRRSSRAPAPTCRRPPCTPTSPPTDQRRLWSPKAPRVLHPGGFRFMLDP